MNNVMTTTESDMKVLRSFNLMLYDEDFGEAMVPFFQNDITYVDMKDVINKIAENSELLSSVPCSVGDELFVIGPPNTDTTFLPIYEGMVTEIYADKPNAGWNIKVNVRSLSKTFIYKDSDMNTKIFKSRDDIEKSMKSLYTISD